MWWVTLSGPWLLSLYWEVSIRKRFWTAKWTITFFCGRIFLPHVYCNIFSSSRLFILRSKGKKRHIRVRNKNRVHQLLSQSKLDKNCALFSFTNYSALVYEFAHSLSPIHFIHLNLMTSQQRAQTTQLGKKDIKKRWKGREGKTQLETPLLWHSRTRWGASGKALSNKVKQRALWKTG